MKTSGKLEAILGFSGSINTQGDVDNVFVDPLYQYESQVAAVDEKGEPLKIYVEIKSTKFGYRFDGIGNTVQEAIDNALDMRAFKNHKNPQPTPEQLELPFPKT